MRRPLTLLVCLFILLTVVASMCEAAPRRQIRQVLRDNYGNTLASATCHVEVSTDKGSTWADATVYSTLTGSTGASGSNLTADSTGVCTGFLDDFDYNFTSTQFRVTATKTGYTAQTYSNILVGPQIGGTYTYSAAQTPTTALDIPYGVIISHGSYTLTFSKQVQAGSYQWLSGSGTVTFPIHSEVKSSWFGSLNDAITALGSGVVTLVVDQAETLTANTTIPSTMTLKIGSGGKITTASRTINPSAASWNGTNDSITFTAAGHGLVDGQRIVVSGCSPSGYSGTWYATVTNSSTINVYKKSDPTTYVGACSIAANYTLAIDGPFEAPMRQVFYSFNTDEVQFGRMVATVSASDGAVTGTLYKMGGVKEVYPQWWGADPNCTSSCSAANMTINTNAINYAIRSLNPARATQGDNKFITGPGGIVKIIGQFWTNAPIILTPKVSLEGLGTSVRYLGSDSEYTYAQSVIFCNESGPACIIAALDVTLVDEDDCSNGYKVGYTSYQAAATRVHGSKIRGLIIKGNASNGSGIAIGDYPSSTTAYLSYCDTFPTLLTLWSTAAYDTEISDNWISYHGGHGIRILNAAGVKIQNNYVGSNNLLGLWAYRQVNGFDITGNHFQSNCDDITGWSGFNCYDLLWIQGEGGNISGNLFEDSAYPTTGKRGMVGFYDQRGGNFTGNYIEISGNSTVASYGVEFYHANQGIHASGNFGAIYVDDTTTNCALFRLHATAATVSNVDITISNNTMLVDTSTSLDCKTMVIADVSAAGVWAGKRLKLAQNVSVLDGMVTTYTARDTLYPDLSKVQYYNIDAVDYDPDKRQVANISDIVSELYSIVDSNTISGLWIFDATTGQTIYDKAHSSQTLKNATTRTYPGGAATDIPATSMGRIQDMPYVTFSTTFVWDTPDADDFTALIGQPMSIVTFAKPNNTAAQTHVFLGKADGGANDEWIFYTVPVGGTTEYLAMVIYDEDTSTSFARRGGTDIVADEDTWACYAAVYDGGTTEASISLYRNGVEETSYTDTAGTITSMRNKAALVGDYYGAYLGRFDGSIAMTMFVRDNLSESQIKRINRLMHSWMGTSITNTALAAAPSAGYKVTSSSTSSTDNAIARFDGTTGRIIQSSSATVDDSGGVASTGLTVTAGTLNAGAKALDMSYTLDSSASAENIGALIAVTSAGTESQAQTAAKMTVSGGYTGSSSFRAFRIENLSASSGNAIASTGMVGNVAGNFLSTGVGALNVGNNGVAANGTAINIGVLGCGGDTEASQSNYGVYGISKSTNTGGVAYGVYGTLDATSTSGAAVGANNGTTTNDIIQAQDNGVVAWAVKDGGETRITSTTSGVGGGLGTKTAYGTANITASASIAITLSIPSGALLRGCSARVSTALAAGENWDLAFSGGSTTALCTNKDDAKQTKCDTLIVPEVASNTTNLAITKNGGGSFTAQGVIDAVCYYDQLTTMADAP